MDPDGALDPVIFAWVCTSDRGSCFSAGATPAVGGSQYYVEAGSMVPGTYRIKVSAHPKSRVNGRKCIGNPGGVFGSVGCQNGGSPGSPLMMLR